MLQSASTWLLRLYPRAWRDRYGEEFSALLIETRLSPFVICDVIIGAADAHLHPELAPERVLSMASRLRTSAITIFCAYITFVIAGLALNSATDDTQFAHMIDSHIELAVPWYFLMGAAVISLLAVVVGGVPIVWSIWRDSPAQRRLLLVPVACFIVIAIPPAIAIFLIVSGRASNAPTNTPASSTAVALVTAYGVLFVLAAILSTWAVTAAVRRGAVAPDLFRFALLPETVTTVAMVAMLLATLVVGFFANQDDPAEFQRLDLRLPTTLSFTTWFGIVVVMVIATSIAGLALRRGFAARALAS